MAENGEKLAEMSRKNGGGESGENSSLLGGIHPNGGDWSLEEVVSFTQISAVTGENSGSAILPTKKFSDSANHMTAGSYSEDGILQ